MAREFKLPDLGEGVAEGEIVKWLVSEGDDIKEDQPMVEVMTDKATVQIPSPSNGKVAKILAKEGQTVKVGTTVVVLDTDHKSDQSEKKDSEATRPLQRSKEEDQTREPAQYQETQRIIATPATRKIAREMGVEIDSLKGSGPSGRITEEDVKRAAQSKSRQIAPQVQVPARAIPETKIQHPARDVTPQVLEEHVPLHGIRKRIAEKMAKSSASTAHVTHIDEVDFTELIELRQNLKPIAEDQKVKLTFLPFIMKAAVSALKRYPYFNASIDEEKQRIVLKQYYNIGFATDTSAGLIVPVVRDADKKSLVEIARDIEDLSSKAREGKISLEEIQGGTFTITNIGTLGGVISTPIINMPEVAILGVHKIQKKPVVKDNQIVIREMGFLALTFDHRIVDGADAARFLSKIISLLESPGMFIMDGTRFDSGK